MPNKPTTACSTPGCPERADKGRCGTCKGRRQGVKDRRRGSPTARGYGGTWPARRLDFLTRHRWCRLDGRFATVADHYPVSRRDLVARGVADPDADEHLRPLCKPCHDRETAAHQPGGWHREQKAV